MKILAIETSCDETAISILEIKDREKRPVFNILSNIVSSQVKIHAEWGGVVPGLAKREHQANLIPTLKKALKKSNLPISNFQFLISKQKEVEVILEREPVLLEKIVKFLKKNERPNIDAIAVTQGPGLEPALWVGVNFAKALATAWNKPLIPVNHMEGHLLSPFLKDEEFSIPEIDFPVIGLLVSGGHTQIILVKNPPKGEAGWGKYELIGETRDDAAGEAFDKVAKMMDLGYPGGPIISNLAKLAEEDLSVRHRMSNRIELPRPMIDDRSPDGEFDFSFSGLKTAVLYKTKEFKELTPEIKAEIAKEFQQAVIDVLISKTLRAAEKYKAKVVILGGGVTANKEFRKQFLQKIKKEKLGFKFHVPGFRFCGDNAAMIALAAYFNQKKGPALDERAFAAEGNLSF